MMIWLAIILVSAITIYVFMVNWKMSGFEYGLISALFGFLFSLLVCGFIFGVAGAAIYEKTCDKEFTKELDNYNILPIKESKDGTFRVGYTKIDNEVNYVVYLEKTADKTKELRKQFFVPLYDCTIVISEDEKPSLKRDAIWKVAPYWFFGNFRNEEGDQRSINKWKLTIPGEVVLEPM